MEGELQIIQDLIIEENKNKRGENIYERALSLLQSNFLQKHHPNLCRKSILATDSLK